MHRHSAVRVGASLEIAKTRLLISAKRAAITWRRVYETHVDGRVPEHDICQELSEDARAESSMHVESLADEEIESLTGTYAVKTPRSSANGIELNVADRHLAAIDDIRCDIGRPGHPGEIFGLHLAERRSRSVPPLQHVRCIQPAVKQRQVVLRKPPKCERRLRAIHTISGVSIHRTNQPPR